MIRIFLPFLFSFSVNQSHTLSALPMSSEPRDSAAYDQGGESGYSFSVVVNDYEAIFDRHFFYIINTLRNTYIISQRGVPLIVPSIRAQWEWMRQRTQWPLCVSILLPFLFLLNLCVWQKQVAVNHCQTFCCRVGAASRFYAKGDYPRAIKIRIALADVFPCTKFQGTNQQLFNTS